MSEFRVESTFSAKPEHVYAAFTNEAMLDNWMATDCRVDVRTTGYYNYYWQNGFLASGIYSAVEANKHLVASWFGKGDPGETEVEVTIAAENGGARVSVTHRGFGEGAAWTDSQAAYKRNWEQALANLHYYLETGLDLRIMKRPMIGVYPQDLDDDLREKYSLQHIPSGVFLTQVVEGGGAAASGLKAHDVIVKADGKDIGGFADMLPVLNSHKAGDTVPVEIWRGSEKFTVDLTFAERAVPEVPKTHPELITAVKEHMAAVMGEMDALLNGVPEAVRAHKPAEKEWSINDQLAHLIITERAITTYLWMNIHGGAVYPYGKNDPFHLVVGATNRPDSESLIAELRQVLDEHIAAVEALPATIIENRGLFLTLSANLNFSGEHIRGHIRQMSDCLESAKVAA